MIYVTSTLTQKAESEETLRTAAQRETGRKFQELFGREQPATIRALSFRDLGLESWTVQIPIALKWESIVNTVVNTAAVIVIYGIAIDPRESAKLQSVRFDVEGARIRQLETGLLYLPASEVREQDTTRWEFKPRAYFESPLVIGADVSIGIDVRADHAGQCTMILIGEVMEKEGRTLRP